MGGVALAGLKLLDDLPNVCVNSPTCAGRGGAGLASGSWNRLSLGLGGEEFARGDRNMRVNSPGAGSLGADGTGLETGGSWGIANMRVNSPV